MARLPQPWELSGPVSQRSGRQYIAADTTAIGEGIASFGASLSAVGRERKQQENAVDIARAEAYKTQELLRVGREFDNDPDYATYDKRAPKVTGDVVNKAASVIRDPAMRERWQLNASTDAARTNEAIFGKADALKKQTEIVGMDDALEAQRRIYVDPETTEEQKDLARRDIEATISVGESTGLFTPFEADKRRQAYLEAADLSRALLVAESDPDAVAGYGDPSLPAGMRNNNPGNIKYIGQGRDKGVVGPSENTDHGNPQAVFVTPEAGMREAYRLAMSKYNNGKVTANQLIADEDIGWTPGNYDAAANIARGMGLGPDDDLNLSDPASAQKFLRSLVTQEHGKASAKYSDDLIARAVSGGAATIEDLPIITGKQGGRTSAPDMDGVNPDLLSTFKKVQNAFGRSIPIVSGFRGAARNAAAGGAEGSQHLEGNAIDLDVSDMSKDERLELIRVASSMGITGIGVYKNSLHFDVGQRRSWGPSYGIESVPAWAKDAINDHLAGKSAPIGTGRTRPAYIDRLSPEDRAKVFETAGRARTLRESEAAAAQKAASGAAVDEYRLRISTFDPRLSQNEILNDTRIDAGQKATLLNSFNEESSGNVATNELLRALSQGDAPVNAFDSKQTGAADKAFDKLMGAAQTPEQQQIVASDFVDRTGYVPKTMQNEIRQGANSNDPAQMAQAMQAALAISSMLPGRMKFDGSEDVQKKADLFRAYTQSMGYSAEDAARRVIAASDPQTAAQRKALLSSDTVKKSIKAIDASKVSAIFDDSFLGLGSNPALGANPAAEAAMVSEYKSLYEEALFDAAGDATVAEKTATERFRRTYGVSDFTTLGNTVIRNPVEKTYPAGPDGSHDWVRAQAIEALTNEGVKSDEIYLMPLPDGGTDKDVLAGKPPRYQILYKDPESGNIEQFNLPFFADPQAAQDQFMQQKAAIRAESERRMLEARSGGINREDAIGTALSTTAGPDWMKARAAETAVEKQRMQQTIDELRNARGAGRQNDQFGDAGVLYKTSRMPTIEAPKTSRLPTVDIEKTMRYPAAPKTSRIKPDGGN